jgi:hypothetical protein
MVIRPLAARKQCWRLSVFGKIVEIYLIPLGICVTSEKENVPGESLLDLEFWQGASYLAFFK